MSISLTLNFIDAFNHSSRSTPRFQRITPSVNPSYAVALPEVGCFFIGGESTGASRRRCRALLIPQTVDAALSRYFDRILGQCFDFTWRAGDAPLSAESRFHACVRARYSGAEERWRAGATPAD
jgi:hypothetical protein